MNPLVPMSGDLRRAAGRTEATVLVIVDQLEELLGEIPEDAADVLQMLRFAGDASGCPLVVLATMRSDFLAALQNHPATLDLTCELMAVGPMSAGEVAQVIEEPAKAAGLELEPGLVHAMLSDTDTDDALPLLAFTLRELFDHFGDDGRLDMKEYHELGGLHGALVRVADELVESQRLTRRGSGTSSAKPSWPWSASPRTTAGFDVSFGGMNYPTRSIRSSNSSWPPDSWCRAETLKPVPSRSPTRRCSVPGIGSQAGYSRMPRRSDYAAISSTARRAGLQVAANQPTCGEAHDWTELPNLRTAVISLLAASTSSSSTRPSSPRAGRSSQAGTVPTPQTPNRRRRRRRGASHRRNCPYCSLSKPVANPIAPN